MHLYYIIIKKKIYLIIILILFFIIDINDILLYKYSYNKEKIKIGIVAHSIKNGGCERQTSILLTHFNKVKNFELFLFTNKEKEDNEYTINENIKRMIIKNNLVSLLKQENIDVLLYQLYSIPEIYELNKLKNIKIIYINRSSFLHWVYYDSFGFCKYLYKAYKDNNYTISLIPFENYYLFKKWGIKSILMNNFIAYEYRAIIPSDLSSKIILMIGRAEDKIKRLDLGIMAMEYIVKEIPECEMKIISEINNNTVYLEDLIHRLKLEKNIKFVGYYSRPEDFYKNASLHIFPTLAEAFPNVLSETLIYGIPNILAGLDYVSTALGGGTIIVYDDSPFSIAKIAVKILKDNKLRKKLGKDARKNMRKYKNSVLFRKWIKLIFGVYKGGFYEKQLRIDKQINEYPYKQIFENQIKLLRLRKKKYINITINDIINFTFMEN